MGGIRAAIFVGLILIGLLLFFAKRWISDNTLSRLSNAFGIVAFLAAALVLVLPPSEGTTPFSGLVPSAEGTSSSIEKQTYPVTFINNENFQIQLGDYAFLPPRQLVEIELEPGLYSIPIVTDRFHEWDIGGRVEFEISETRYPLVFDCGSASFFKLPIRIFWGDHVECRLRHD